MSGRMLVGYVYGRAKGDCSQEIGGAMVTLAALGMAVHLNIETCAKRELVRVWKNSTRFVRSRGAHQAMTVSFDECYAQAVSAAMAQAPDDHGNPPLASATRYSLMLGQCAIPVFGNYHSRDLDERTARALLAQWLNAHGWTIHCDPNDLPVAWGHFANEGAHRIVDWTVQWRESGQQRTAIVPTKAEAVARSTRTLVNAGLATPLEQTPSPGM